MTAAFTPCRKPQTFYMLFYRKDILAELGLEVPNTWEDVIHILPVLQKKNLNFGFPKVLVDGAVGLGLPVYATFLFQNGGSLYTANGSKNPARQQGGGQRLLRMDEVLHQLWPAHPVRFSQPLPFGRGTHRDRGILELQHVAGVRTGNQREMGLCRHTRHPAGGRYAGSVVLRHHHRLLHPEYGEG